MSARSACERLVCLGNDGNEMSVMMMMRSRVAWAGNWGSLIDIGAREMVDCLRM